jgi:hypothetical protein
MALVKSYAVACEKCLFRAGPWMRTAAQARALARRRGWQRVPADKERMTPAADLCPMHATKED